MNTVHVIAAMLMALSAPAVFAGESVVPPLVEGVVDGATVVSPLIEDAAAGDQVTEQGEEDDTRPMRELCASYADDEGVVAEEREAHIDECINSMTDLSDSMQEKFEGISTDPETGAESTGMMNTTNTAGMPGVIQETSTKPAGTEEQAATHPEELVADELVDKPAPGVEELIPKSTAKVE